jgi:aspartyl-tRNA(Asn)/glutamyl-tRNA(Gln) amidotransferase subunit A
VFADVDVIATPTIAWTAPRVEAFQRGSLAYTAPPFTGLFNLTGGPSLSMPCGTDRNGLPIGLMLSGPVHADALVVGVGQIYEKVSSWADSMSNACV